MDRPPLLRRRERPCAVPGVWLVITARSSLRTPVVWQTRALANGEGVWQSLFYWWAETARRDRHATEARDDRYAWKSYTRKDLQCRVQNRNPTYDWLSGPSEGDRHVALLLAMTENEMERDEPRSLQKNILDHTGLTGPGLQSRVIEHNDLSGVCPSSPYTQILHKDPKRLAVLLKSILTSIKLTNLNMK